MTQLPVLRDFVCPGCGKGTSRVGRACLDCVAGKKDDDAA